MFATGCDNNGTPDGGGDLGSSGDAGTDLGTADLGPADSGPPDLGPPDLGPPDLGPPCVGPPMLWSDTACSTLATGVRLYAPEFTLWADGASKERYVYLPPGSKIDVTDPDHWNFPMGTRFYKLFGLGTTKLEIRTLEKTAPDPGLGSWSVHSWEWSADGLSMTDTTSAGAMNILGTEHDIPSRAQCGSCHGPASDAILGFSAVQLAHGTGLDLATLNAEGWLGTMNAGGTLDPATIDPATAEIPGTGNVRAALGYLNANCAQCHHGPGAPAGMRLDVLTGLTMPSETQAYVTAVGVATTGFHMGGISQRVVPGDPSMSAIPYRMMHRGDTAQMPPLGTELVDDAGVTTISAWITGLP